METKTIFTGTAVSKNRDLADKIKANLKTEGAAQIVEEKPREAYEGNLPDGITMDTVKAVGSYNNEFVNAARLAVAEVAADMFTKDKELTTVQSKLGYYQSRDSVQIRAERSKVSRVPTAMEPGAERVETTRYMALTTVLDHYGTSGATLRAEISEQAANLFGK